MMVRKAGLEPACLSAPPPQDGVSANSTTSAISQIATAGQELIIAKGKRSPFERCNDGAITQLTILLTLTQRQTVKPRIGTWQIKPISLTNLRNVLV